MKKGIKAAGRGLWHSLRGVYNRQWTEWAVAGEKKITLNVCLCHRKLYTNP